VDHQDLERKDLPHREPAQVDGGEENALRKHGPLLAALALFWAAAALTLVESTSRNDGRFVYALDDTYIHVVLARTLAEDGTWGIAPGTFASCSSSPLWTALLAGAFVVAGAAVALPGVLALLCASLLLAEAHRGLLGFGAGPAARFAILLAMALATPLVTLVFVANEHALHALFTLALAVAGVRALAREDAASSGAPLLGALAAGTVATRYEGVLLVAVVAALLACRRRWRPAAASALGGAAPVIAFGLFSLAHGASFLPDSVLMKAKYPWADLATKILAYLGPSAISEALKTPALAALVIGAAILLVLRLRRTRRFWEPVPLLLFLFVATALLHMDLARTGEFFRYEAYLIALGVFATGLALTERPGGRALATAAVLLLVAAPLAWRSFAALRDTPVATGNIYQQQFQTASFLRDHYAGAAVAVNDIGLVNFLADIRCLDLWGLANRDVAAARRRGVYGPETMRALAETEGAGVAVVFERWFARFGGLPPEWERVGQWTIPDNVACGSPTVSFFATRASARGGLASSLREYSSRLPAAVAQSGPYLEGR
jgi:hypothetical protein